MPRRSTRLSTREVEGKHDLLSVLPPELIEIISTHLGGRGVLSFRQTCRAAHALSIREFHSHFITERPFLLNNKASLDRLIEIVEDPEKRRYLKCVPLSLASLEPSKEDYRARRSWAKKKGLTSPEDHVKTKSQRELHGRLLQEQSRHRREGISQELTSAIYNMRDGDVDIGIKVTDVGFNIFGEHFAKNSHPEDPVAWGYDRLCDSLGYRRGMDKNINDHWGWVVLLKTLRRAHCAPSSLELGNAWNGVPLPMLTNRWLGKEIQTRPFRNLTTLRLCLSLGLGSYYPVRNDADHDEERQESVRNSLIILQLLLLDAPKIQTLGLSVASTSYDVKYLSSEVFPAIFAIYDYILHDLRDLELEGLVVSLKEITMFTVRHQQLLRSLSMRFIKSEKTPPPHAASGHAASSSEDSDYRSALVKRCLIGMVPGLKITSWQNVYDGLPQKFYQRTADIYY